MQVDNRNLLNYSVHTSTFIITHNKILYKYGAHSQIAKYTIPIYKRFALFWNIKFNYYLIMGNFKQITLIFI